jgi:hypothetical protein
MPMPLQFYCFILISLSLSLQYYQSAHQFYSCGVILTLLTNYSVFLITLFIKRSKSFQQQNKSDRSVSFLTLLF